MNNLYLTKDKGRILLITDNTVFTIFDIAVYSDITESFNSKKYLFLESFSRSFSDMGDSEMKNRFLYLFNFALVNNMVNYIIDKYESKNISEIIFDSKIKKTDKDIVHFSKKLDISDVLGDVIICLINSEEYLNGNLKMDYGNVPEFINKTNEIISIESIFKYIPVEMEKLINKLKIDLLAFHYVKESFRDENERYILPIYVDEESLMKKGITDFNDYLVNWVSLAYLNMVTKIHDHFVDYYELGYEKGLVYDDLTLAVLSLSVGKLCPYPKGLAKSIEVGRETSGKCYFINGIVSPVSLMQELAIILQIKDVFNIVPKVFRSKH